RVMTPFRQLGLGTELIRQGEAQLRHRNIFYATIAVAKDNVGALRLYERNGYRIYDDDEGQWSYTDHKGKLIHVHEPCWMLEKHIDS
ncbi:MAG: GNAT family N-acetyltransferase, partial [Anaerolineales bacterium]